jgi:hypothetical protein
MSALVATFTPDSVEWDDPICWDPMSMEDDFSWKPEELDISALEDLGHDIITSLPEGMPSDPFISDIVLGEEVGDDRLDFSRSPIRLAAALIVQERIMGMKTSFEDTYISNWIWNFCEVSNPIPSDMTQSYHFGRKTGNFKNLGFTDVPPLRIILDVMKGDRSHSSTVPGKAGMLGNRLRTPNPQHLASLQLASYIQDGMLRTSMSTEPKYLPQIMGGSGTKALFNNPKNLYISTYAYRGGKCQRVYGTACRELQQCLSLMERNQTSMPVLCTKLRDKQEYLHGTYAEKVFIPPSYLKDDSKENQPKPILLATGGANRFACFENRLHRTKSLVTRTEAERQYEYYTRVKRQLLSGATLETTDSMHRLEKARARKRFGDALSANTAFANLLDRNATIKDVRALLDMNFIPVNTGVTHFTMWDAEFLFNGGRSETYSIEDLTTTEDLFVRTEVSEEETYKIGGLPLRPIIGNKFRQVETRTKVGLYEISESMEEWAAKLLHNLQQSRVDGGPVTRDVALQIFEKDPEWVNDDTLLIERCLRDTANLNLRTARVILVSADKRLANQMSNTCNVSVHRLDPLDYIKFMHSKGLDFHGSPSDIQLLSTELNKGGRKDEFRALYLDTGSIMATASKLDVVPDDDRPHLVMRIVEESGFDNLGHRFSHYSLKELDCKRDVPVRIHNPVRLPKRYRYGNYPENHSNHTPSGSWRSTGSVS